MVEVDWRQAGIVALTGVLSVFLALGILSLVVSIMGNLSGQSKKMQVGQNGKTGDR